MARSKPVVPVGRVRRTAPLAGLAARSAGGAVTDILRRRLRGERGASLEFHLRNAERYASLLSRSKGVLMKAGQLMSFIDAGLVPPEYQSVYQQALSGLQADAEPMPYDLVAAVVEADLGRPPEALFASFDHEPLAAASIGQVHAATLADGTDAVLKVQYPGVADAIRDDLANTELLTTFLKIAKGLVPNLTSVDPKVIAAEVGARIGEELDYTTELANQADFADKYRDHPFIRIPAVFPELSGPHVLTMGLARGRQWEEAVLADQDLRNRWGETIERFIYGSIYRWGLFNADPQPGNYIFHDDGTVTFLDFGCVKRFSEEVRVAFFAVADAMLANDPAALKRQFVRVGFIAEDDVGADELFAWQRQVFVPMLSDGPFTFTPEYVAETIAMFDPFGSGAGVNRKVGVPQDFVFFTRIMHGRNAVLGALRATADWRAIYEEHRTGVPASELGAMEVEYFAGRRNT